MFSINKIQQRLPCLTLLFILLTLSNFSYADIASPHAVHTIQPDGTAIVLYIRGNSRFNWQEDADGYTVLREHGNRGRYLYARRAGNGHLEKTTHEVGKSNPKAFGLQRKIRPSAAVLAQKIFAGPAGQSDSEASAGQPEVSAPALTLKNLVVLIRFSDHTGRIQPSRSDIDTLMNAIGGDADLAPAGSLKDIYLNNSYGALTIESTVVAWATLPRTEAYYAGGNSGLISTIHQALKEALEIIDPVVNFNDFNNDNDPGNYIDAITFLHSGYGAEWGGDDAYGTDYTDRIWSHKWGISGGWTSDEGVKVYNYHISPAIWGRSGSSIGRIGVIAHETGHFLGLPDLYDTDSGAGDGIGSWGLMANSWGGDGSQQPPPLMSPWSKLQLGWITPTALSSPGTYFINEALNNNHSYIISDGYPSGEYLLVENRKRIYKDSNNMDIVADNIPRNADGLVVWHIDDSSDYSTQGYPGQGGWPSNGNHYRVAVLQADGNYDMEKGNNRGDSGDAYRAGFNDYIGPGSTPDTDAYQLGSNFPTNHELSSISSANALMTFVFNANQQPLEPPASPSDLVITATGHYDIALQWSDNANNEDTFILERKDSVSQWATVTTLAANSITYNDSGLIAATSYDYRIKAQNSAGDSGYSNIASTTTTLPQPPSPPENLYADVISSTQINLSWIDGSNETSLEIKRSSNGETFNSIATLPANTISYEDSNLEPATSYDYQIIAVNSDGTAMSGISATTLPPSPLAYAFAQSTASGTTTGSYTDTQLEDDNSQVITEVLSGRGKNARSQLEHTWQIGPVAAGAQVVLTVVAQGSNNSEGDDFEFSYSNDDGITFTPVLTANSAIGTVELAAQTSGTVLLRVRDTDRSKGNSSLDSISVDFIMISSNGEIVLSPPTNLAGSAVSSSQISLTWDDATGESRYSIFYSLQGMENWISDITDLSANSSAYTVNNLAASTGYDFKVCAEDQNNATACSQNITITTLADNQLPLLLTADGVKVKGVHVVTLSWTGGNGQPVVVYRDGVVIPCAIANNSCTDNTGNKGGRSYLYHICPTDSSACSASVSVNF